MAIVRKNRSSSGKLFVKPQGHKSVSYTHLDVYKRQNERIAADREKYSRQIKELFEQKGLSYVSLAGDYLAVSYTHLDVYKRQVLARVGNG